MKQTIWTKLKRVTLLASLITAAFAALPARAQVKVIFDTDIGSDCDDAGAMAVLHKLADDGDIQILATVHSSRNDTGDNPYGVGCMDAVNTYYNRPNLRLGDSPYQDVGDATVKYVKPVATDTSTYGHNVVTDSHGDVENMVDLYVNLLQNNENVVIVTVGHPIALYHLLNEGHGSLVASKVDRWVAMGGGGGSGGDPSQWHSDWNLSRNGMSNNSRIGYIFDNWPTDVYISPLGVNVKTGKTLMSNHDDTNPVRKSYRVWLGSDNKNRSSWDQIAVLFAAFGDNSWFNVTSNGRWEFRTDHNGQVRWNGGTNNSKHFRVTQAISDSQMQAIVSDYMNEPPGPGTGNTEAPSVNPVNFDLHQNYPNPFNPSTRIQFKLPQAGHIRFTVYNAMGREVAILADGHYTAGLHSVTFDASSLSSSLYFYKLQAAEQQAVRKMMQMK